MSAVDGTASAGLSPAAASETLTFTTPFAGGTTRQIDLGRKGLGAGDLFLSTGIPMRDLTTGARIGTLEGTETILSAAYDGTVSQPVTMRLRGGTVTVTGIVRHTDSPNRLAVSGGTGRYAETRGQLVLVREDDKRKLSVNRLELMP